MNLSVFLRRPVAVLLFLLSGAVVAFVTYGLIYWAYSAPEEKDLPFASGFESGDLKDWSRWGQRQFCCSHSYRVVEKPVRDGRYALQVHLKLHDPDVRGNRRSELRLEAGKMGGSYSYKFSEFVPDTWIDDSPLATVAQWHGVPDKLYGEAGRSPPLRLGIVGNEWMIGNFWDSNRVTRFWGGKKQTGGYRLLYTAPLEKGKWVDWEFRVRWSSGSDGLVEVWKDGVQVVDAKGPNTYNDRYAPYFKIGIYIPPWKAHPEAATVKERTIFIDQISESRWDPGGVSK